MQTVKSIIVMAVLSLGIHGAAFADDRVPNRVGAEQTSPSSGKAELLGRWELAETITGMPKGTTWDFRTDGTLVISGMANGKVVNVDFKYELKGNYLYLVHANGKTDAIGVEKLTATEFVLKDSNATVAKFHRPSSAQASPAMAVLNLPGTNWLGSENLGEGYGKLRFEFRSNGKVVMHDARNSIEGSYQMQGNQLSITIPGACRYVGVINRSTFAGLGQDNSRSWNFSVNLDR